MAFEMFRILAICNILGHVLVNGLPTGAPLFACETGTNIVPNHASNTPSTSPVPYSVDLSNIPSNGYVPGRNYNIILRGSSSNTDFKGFMIQGRVRADDSPTGTFGSGTNYQSQCTGNTAATHTSRDEKTSVTLVWTAPAAGTGCICFRYAFVDQFVLFWANQTTPCISENLQTSIQASSSGSISGDSFTISVSANVTGEFECSLDNGAFQTCLTGDVFTGLSAGSHSIVVQFTPDGHCQPIVLQPSLDFDIILPSPPTTIQARGSVSISGNTATLTLAADVIGSYQCKLDDGAFQPCSSGTTFPGLSAGSHTIDVQFTPDGSTETFTLQPTITFTIAMMTTLLPTPTPIEIQASGSATVSGNAANVTLSADVAGAFQCSLDGAAFQSCSTGTTFSGLSVGDHSIVVQFTPDGSSQVLTLEPAIVFSITSPTPLPPVVNVRVTIVGNKITVFYNVSEDADCTCQLDSDEAVPCNSPHMFSDVKPGDHVVVVSCTSRSTGLTTTQRLDVSVSVQVSSTATISGNTATIILNASAVGNFECSLDGEDFKPCSTGTTFSGLSAGGHSIVVQFTPDGSSQVLTLEPAINFTIQAILPALSISVRITAVGNNLIVSFNTSEPATCTCQLDSQTPEPCVSGHIFTGVAPGDHTVNVSCTGDTTGATVSRSLSISVSAQVNASATISGDTANLTLNADVAGTFECNVDGGPFEACSTGSLLSGLSAGSHTIIIRFSPDGSSEVITRQLDFVIAMMTTVLPTPTPIDIQANGSVTITGNTATLTLTSAVPGTFQCSLDGGLFQTCRSGQTFPGLSSGSHSIVVQFTAQGSSQVLTLQPPADFVIPGDTTTTALATTTTITPTTTTAVTTTAVPATTTEVFPTTTAVPTTTIEVPTATPARPELDVTTSATFSGTEITVFYVVSANATCTCRLDSETPEPCIPGHIFSAVAQEEHRVTVTCTSVDNPGLTASSTVTGLEFLDVTLALEESGTTITVLLDTNIEATHRCKLDDADFVDCFSGFQFVGVPGGIHTVMVESTSADSTSTVARTSGDIVVRGDDAISITDINTDIDIQAQNYTFTFDVNEKPPNLTYSLLIDGSPIRVPFSCHRISDTMCYCTISLSGGEYVFGPHSLTIEAVLNGDTRGRGTTGFVVTDAVVVGFQDIGYSVVEGDINFSVVVQKIGSNGEQISLQVSFVQESATVGTDFPAVQSGQGVQFEAGPSTQKTFNFSVTDDSVVECNETFRLQLVPITTDLLRINPARSQAVITIIDDDATEVGFFGGGSPISEGDSGRRTIAYLSAITQSFMVTVESYSCPGTNAAIPGVDYDPVNQTLTFTPSMQFNTITIQTIEDTIFEALGQAERICLRLTNPVEPCPNSVVIGDDIVIQITEDDAPVFNVTCYTNTTGNTVDGRSINVFYEAAAQFSPAFQCSLNNGPLQPCSDPPPQVYSPLSYGNHTVTVSATSTINRQTINVTHRVLMVQGRLRAVNSSAIQISIQSTKSATYRCKLNDLPYFQCNDGDIISNLDPDMYTLVVEATSSDQPPQFASDNVGPITLTGGSGTSTCSGRVELNSTDGSSSYTANWRGRGNRIEFELTGRGQGWVGIGFSHNREMINSDIIVGAADGSNFFVHDRFATEREMPPRDAIQNIDNAFAAFEDGITTVRFSRQRDTGDVNDFSLSDCVHFLYAWGGAVTNINNGRIRYHGMARRFISDSLECIPTSASFCPERFNCGDPGTPANGDVFFDDTLEGSVANYTCNAGFRLEGDDQRVCQSNAMWSGAVPTCILIDCGDPGEPANGIGNYTNTTVGSVVTYECDIGFRPIGDIQRTCQPSGLWTGLVAICQVIDCGDPGEPTNGNGNYTSTTVGSVVTYDCVIGFRLVGDTQRTCQPSGMWIGVVPMCQVIDCGDPGVPANGSGNYINTTVGSLVAYDCDSGFRLVGNAQRMCQSDGMWTGTVPVCQRINCGDPGMVTDGMVTSNGTYFTSIARFTCEDGYNLIGNMLRICQLNGIWSGSVPNCQPVNCGNPPVPANGNAAIISTTLGSTVTYSCDQSYVLCGDELRMCLPTGMWSGSVPECIRAVVTVARTSYTVNEDDGFANISIRLNQSSCVTVIVTVLPQVQSPVDASTNDFVNTPITVNILPGDTSAPVSIPIRDDTIVENDEDFDVVLQASSLGVIVGNPGQAVVTIIDNDVPTVIRFERSSYTVNEESEQIEVCLRNSGENEIPVIITVQPSETGSAQAPADFSLTPSIVTFAPGQLRACYNQSVVDDAVPEDDESFTVSIVPIPNNPNVVIGVPGTTQITILDGDRGMIMRNDTVIGDPLYTVPLQISQQVIEADPQVANSSLCYEIHGEAGKIFNLVSDTCVSINAEYIQSSNDSNLNIIGKIGVLAVDNNGDCQRITIDVVNCMGTVGSTEVTSGSPYNVAGIRVRKGRRHFLIAVPNCERQDLVAWVICEQGNMLKFVVTRGFNLRPTSHGLVAQFWNVPVELEEYNGTTPDDVLKYYIVKITPPDGDIREFVGHLYDVTWDFTPIPCVYAGNRNGGPVTEFDDPNDSVIEGRFAEYEVSSLFSTQFLFDQFDNSRCN